MFADAWPGMVQQKGKEGGASRKSCVCARSAMQSIGARRRAGELAGRVQVAEGVVCGLCNALAEKGWFALQKPERNRRWV